MSMKLKNQVTSLELSKKLKELGVKQKSLFFYAESPENEYRLYPLFFNPNESEEISVDKEKEHFSAFNVAELGEMLPSPIQIENQTCYLSIGKVGETYEIGYGKDGSYIHENNEANARAKMLIYLLENNLIK